LVLLVLAHHMNTDSGSCFPSTRKLAEETALSEKSVCDHLDKARKQGWIISRRRGKTAGQAWASNQYQAIFPASFGHKGAEQCSAPFGKGAERQAVGAEPDGNKALNDVQPNSPLNSSKNSVRAVGWNDPPPGAMEAIKNVLKPGIDKKAS
jgi:DNA-binding transcriptional MocR family regulator